MEPTEDATGGAHVHEAVTEHPHTVADIVTGLGWTLRDADDLLEVLQRTVDMAVKVVVGATNAGVTVAVNGPPFTAATIAETVSLLVDMVRPVDFVEVATGRAAPTPFPVIR